MQTRCAQSRTRFEPPFHKIIHAFSLFRHSRLERESSSRKAGLSRLKSLFRFTLSRVRNLSRVAITGSAGFGLLEVLVASVVGTILISGSAKFMQITLQTSNVAKSILVENDFKATIAQGLKDKGCATTAADALLKPASLKTGTTTDDGIGAFKDAIALPGGIQKGDFKESIEVIKMELRGVATEDKRDFVVYYKKKYLGKLNAPDPENCTDTPAVKVTGCYNHYCTVDYDRTNKHCTGSVICQSLTGGGGGLGEAEVNKLIKDEFKRQDCPDTAEGKKQFLRGFEGTNDQLNEKCETPVQPIKECPPGEFVHEIKADGTVECESACSGGKKLFETWLVQENQYDSFGGLVASTGQGYTFEVGKTAPSITFGGTGNVRYTLASKSRHCRCRSGQHFNSENTCITCPDDKMWIQSLRQCVPLCTGDKKWVQADLKCMSCSGGGADWSSIVYGTHGRKCVCPASKKKKKLV